MIPRKRLQVLLYILQIFYVFGDGDPGKEDLLNVNDLIPDNVIQHDTQYDDYTTFTSDRPEEDSSVKAFTKPGTSINSPQNSNFESNDNASYISFNNADGSSSIIRNISVDESQPTSLNVSWNVAGDINIFVLELFLDEKLLQKYNTSDLYYFIKDLEPCTRYKISVIANSSKPSENNNQSVNATTAFMKPGVPSFLYIEPKEPVSLQIKWGIPAIARNCVGKYRVQIYTVENENLQTIETKSTSCTFNNLTACAVYQVSVTPIDIKNDDGLFIHKSSTPTFPTIPSVPVLMDPRSIVTTKNSIALIWNITYNQNNCSLISVFTECNSTYSDGYGFLLVSGKTVTHILGEQKPEKISATVENLSPFTNYKCKAYAKNAAGTSDWSAISEVKTHEDVSSSPENFESLGYQNSMLSFRWDKPLYMPGKLENYRINFTWNPNYKVPDWCESNRTLIVDNISDQSTFYTLTKEEALSHYYAKISAKTGAGWSPESLIEFDSLLGSGIPDQVTRLNCTITSQKNNSNALDTVLSWGLPCAMRGYLHYFTINVVGTRPNFEDHNLNDTISYADRPAEKNEIFSINFGELRPLYNYTFEVFATVTGSTDSGESAFLSIMYPAGIPPQPDPEYVKSITIDPHKARRTTSTAAILLPLFPSVNGEIKYYAIIVSGIPFGNTSTSVRFDTKSGKWPNVSSWEEAMEKDFEIPYQATEPKWNPSNFIIDYGHMKAVKFILGEDTTCPMVSMNTKRRVYCNGPLKPDTWYEVRMRAFTDEGYADSVSLTIKTNTELNVPLVLGVVLGILAIGILTTMMVMVRRCSPRLLLRRIAQSSIPESPVPNPFSRRKFINHCQQLADNPGKLSNEFQLLQTLSIDLQMPSNTACLQANRKKNRYSDILPYDFSRVKLEIIDNDPNSDYINASFIRGYSGQEEYIACQGPKEETSYDFWRMIDQYDIKMIVMLTQLVERGKEKCHQYYPLLTETLNYENLSIKCTSESDYRTYTQRTLLLQKDETQRTITHLHFKDWPDHDVPDDFDAMIHFCQLFRKQFAASKGLAVIHCSAGIGRTGTLMAIDILLQSIKDNQKLDVFGTVYRLRRHRLNMVQRESQYAFIYNCIRQVLKNPYFMKTYKPPPIDPIFPKSKTKTERSDSSTDLADSFDTLRKNSLSTSVDSMQPLCQSSPQTTPKIHMNVLFAGLRYCKSTSAIDTRSNHNRMGRYNSEGYAICESAKDSFSSTSKESADSSSSSIYENIIPLIRPNSDQTVAESADYLTNDSVEKDTSL